MSELPYDDEPRRDDDRPQPDRPYDDERPRARRAPQSNGMATASLVLGILALCGGITALPGIICGIIGLTRVKERGTGGGKATVGLVLSVVGLVLVIPTVLIALLLPAVQKVRESAARMSSSNNLKQIGLGMQNYDSANGNLPPQAICDNDGKKLLSWRVAILPYIEQESLHRQFKLDEPWDSPNNKPLIKFMPKTYSMPQFPNEAADGLTRYQVFKGKNSVFNLAKPQANIPPRNPWSIASLTSSQRGVSDVILCVEGGDPVTWTKPDDLDYMPGQPMPDLKPFYSGSTMALMADGRVVTIRKGTPPSAIAASIDPNSNSRERIDP